MSHLCIHEKTFLSSSQSVSEQPWESAFCWSYVPLLDLRRWNSEGVEVQTCDLQKWASVVTGKRDVVPVDTCSDPASLVFLCVFLAWVDTELSPGVVEWAGIRTVVWLLVDRQEQAGAESAEKPTKEVGQSLVCG